MFNFIGSTATRLLCVQRVHCPLKVHICHLQDFCKLILKVKGRHSADALITFNFIWPRHLPPDITAADMDAVDPKMRKWYFLLIFISLGLTPPPRPCHLLAKNNPIFQLLVQQHFWVQCQTCGRGWLQLLWAAHKVRPSWHKAPCGHLNLFGQSSSSEAALRWSKNLMWHLHAAKWE